MTDKQPYRLDVSNVQKRFGATIALKDVSLQIQHAEVHALIGENGAGKSTLMKILSGVYQPDEGEIQLNGQPFQPSNPIQARNRGIAMIYQELNLAPDLTVAENIMLGEEPGALGWMSRSERDDCSQRALDQLDHGNIPLDIPVGLLSIAEKQVVEIARSLIRKPSVLILDEPTSSLTQVDTQKLFEVIKKLKSQQVSIIYISHFLEECQHIGDRYTVLRDGSSVHSGEMDSADLDTIIHHMVGRELNEIYPKKTHKIGEEKLRLIHLKGLEKPEDSSLVLRSGEILGIAGLVGSGRSETLRATFGLDSVAEGEVRVNGRDHTKTTPRKRLFQSVGMVSENRKEEGLLLNQNLANNLTLTRFSPFSKLGFISEKNQIETSSHWLEKLKVKAQNARQLIGELSGGNQQKIAIGRLLHHEAEVYLLDEPTRGIDIGSKAQIYHLINELACQGKAILFVSSYLPELMGICDTIAVMCRGRIVETRATPDWSEKELMAAAIGQNSPQKLPS